MVEGALTSVAGGMVGGKATSNLEFPVDTAAGTVAGATSGYVAGELIDPLGDGFKDQEVELPNPNGPPRLER